MKLAVSHNTHYAYEGEVSRSIQYLRLTPRSSPRQTVRHWQLELPVPAQASQDAYGNSLHVMVIDQPHDAIRIHATGVVEIFPEREESLDEGIHPLCFLRATELTQADAAIRDYAQGFADLTDVQVRLETLMDDLLQRMPYTPGSTAVHDTAAESFAKGKGVCQDHAHVFIACCRVLGLPARYVSGYIRTGDHGDDPLASHAWVEVWADGGWRSFDVANGSRLLDHHLKLAVGLDYLDACPVRGMRWGGVNESMNAQAAVTLLESAAATVLSPSQ